MTQAEMPQKDENHLKQAAQCWDKGESWEAGKLIYENLPNSVRPRWAGRILKLVLEESGVQSPLFSQVLAIAGNESMWKCIRPVFSSLRQMTLQLDENRRGSGLTKDEELLASIVFLAELVAKVTYNATNPADEFDEDSGWWIATSLRWFVDHAWTEKRFSEAAWSALRTCE